MKLLRMLRAFALVTPLVASAAHADGRSIIVLDGSGSMWGQIDGRPKLEIARDALKTVLQNLPADTEIGLMAYGHREKGACDDIELIVPPAKGTAGAISAAADEMKFLGKTPLTEAVRQAAADLRSTEEKATVILITDGIETCNADPCALGRELESSGVDFTAHVVGFGLTADEGRQVSCLAESTGGQYIEAKDAATLVEALKTAVAEPEPAPAPPPPAPPPAAIVDFNLSPSVLLAAGSAPEPLDFPASVEIYAKAADGTRGNLVYQQYGLNPMKIAPGTYLMAVRQDEAEVQTEITLTDSAEAKPEIVMNAGYLTLRPLTEDAGDPVSGASVSLRKAEKEIFHYGEAKRLLPAGSYDYSVTIGKGSVSGQITVEAGKDMTQDVVVAVGVAVVDTLYSAGQVMPDSGQWVEILAAKAALDGSRKSIEGGYGAAQEFTLPPGDYIARAQKDVAEAEQAFSVKANERASVSVVLNAGVLAVMAPGARSIEIFDGTAGIDGKRKSRRFEYGESINLVFPPGEYLISAEHGENHVEAMATVAAGERTEITVPAP